MEFEVLQGQKTIFTYESPFYYDLIFEQKANDLGWSIIFKKTPFKTPFLKNEEGWIAEQYKSKAHFFFAYLRKSPKSNQKIAWLSVEHILWNNTSRVWDIDVSLSYRYQGYGSELMDFIKCICKENGSRAIVLECQSSNYPAIQFYRKMGFQLGGFDSIAYSNRDKENHEVRLEMVYRFPTP